jgi:hypothetical protein
MIQYVSPEMSPTLYKRYYVPLGVPLMSAELSVLHVTVFRICNRLFIFMPQMKFGNRIITKLYSHHDKQKMISPTIQIGKMNKHGSLHQLFEKGSGTWESKHPPATNYPTSCPGKQCTPLSKSVCQEQSNDWYEAHQTSLGGRYN